MVIKYGHCLYILCSFLVGGSLHLLFFDELLKSQGRKATAAPAASLLQGSAVSFCLVEDAILKK